MGFDQDDILLALWTTIKYRVAGTSLANVNRCAAAAVAGSVNTSINKLSRLYPNRDRCRLVQFVIRAYHFALADGDIKVVMIESVLVSATVGVVSSYYPA